MKLVLSPMSIRDIEEIGDSLVRVERVVHGARDLDQFFGNDET